MPTYTSFDPVSFSRACSPVLFSLALSTAVRSSVFQFTQAHNIALSNTGLLYIIEILEFVPTSSTLRSAKFTMADLSWLPEHLRSPNNCHKDLIPGWPYSYGYQPSLAAGVTFCVLFGVALLSHGVQAIHLRRWTSILLAVGALSTWRLIPTQLIRTI